MARPERGKSSHELHSQIAPHTAIVTMSTRLCHRVRATRVRCARSLLSNQDGVQVVGQVESLFELLAHLLPEAVEVRSIVRLGRSIVHHGEDGANGRTADERLNLLGALRRGQRGRDPRRTALDHSAFDSRHRLRLVRVAERRQTAHQRGPGERGFRRGGSASHSGGASWWSILQRAVKGVTRPVPASEQRRCRWSARGRDGFDSAGGSACCGVPSRLARRARSG